MNDRMPDANGGNDSGDADATVRLRLDIAYDGTEFLGWAKQPKLRTVQGELEAALAIVFGRYGSPPMLTVAGRTDAGVHAIGQVAHLDLNAAQFASLRRLERDRSVRAKPSRDKSAHGQSAPNSSAQGSSAQDAVLPKASRPDGPAALARRLNGIAGLDSDIHVSRVSLAPPGFDARFSAIWRRYEYRVADATGPHNPLERHRTLWYPAELDVTLMEEAARSLVGLHDWASFCKPRDGATTIRTLQEFAWTREADGVLIARVKADAFCHSMVRSLVGATIAVGERKLPPDRLTWLREELSRSSEFKVVPAKGLTLVELGYPDDADLAARALQTRARRTTTV